MFKKIMSKINPTNDTLKETLLSSEFDTDNALSLISSSKIDINYEDENGYGFLAHTLKRKNIKLLAG